MQDLKDRLLERPRTANTGAVIGSASTESDVLAFIDVLVQVREGVGQGGKLEMVGKYKECGSRKQSATCWFVTRRSALLGVGIQEFTHLPTPKRRR